MSSECTDQLLQAGAVFLIEVAGLRGVEVQYRHDLPGDLHRYDDLGAGADVAGDVARERVHVRHNLRFTTGSCGTAHSASQGNPDAGRTALERSQHQLLTPQEVPAGPVQVRQPGENLRGSVAQVGQPVGLTLQQQVDAFAQLPVQLRLAGWFRPGVVVEQEFR